MKELDTLLFRFPYRYEVLLGAVLLIGFFYGMTTGVPGLVLIFSLALVILDARNISQYKRGTEDMTALDQLLSRIPFRYELLLLIAVVLWVLWGIAAGMTGFLLGLGVVVLCLRARSSSQIKHNTAVTISEVEG